MGVTVRPMRSADRGAVQAALFDCGAFTDDEVQVALEMVDAGLAGEYTLLAAETNGGVQGYACFGPAPLTATSWYVYWICVSRAAQGTGVGQGLQAGIEAAVCELSGDRLVVETSGRPEYERARRFYRQGGFAEVGRIPDFYNPDDDCVIYCKPLTEELGR